jgi:nucleoside-diphosphate-sugar epimerase
LVSNTHARRILVTGATGFTGSHLSERLAKEGVAVRVLVRDPGRCEALRRLGVEVVVGDLRDPGSLERAVAGTDVIYHIAALFRPENVSRKEMWDTNVEGTANLLHAGIRAGVERFVHCSTVGVHGDIKSPPANEETAYSPGDRYQESKTEGERLVLQSMSEGRLPIVVFRPGGIYGPRDLRFLKLIKAIKTRRFVMLGSGEVIYQMIYIDDLIDGILLCGTEDRAIGNVYILTGEDPLTLSQLARTIAEVVDVRPTRLRFPVTPVYLAGAACELLCKPFGINPPLYRRRVDFFRKTRSFDTSKARNELGFRPKTDLKTGIRLTVDWYREHGYL